MKRIRVRDLMVPLTALEIVSENAGLLDSLLALKRAVAVADGRAGPGAVFVLGVDRKIVGRIDYWDFLRAVEPGYGKLDYPREVAHLECCSDCRFESSVRNVCGVWRKRLENLCSEIPETSTGDIMHPLKNTDFINEDASLEEALNKLVVHHLESLLVTGEGETAGLLMMSDVAGQILNTVGECSESVSDGAAEEEAA